MLIYCCQSGYKILIGQGLLIFFHILNFLDNVQFNRFVKNLTKALELFEMSDLIWLDTVINCIANRTDIHNTQLLEELREKSYNQENITKLLNKSIDNIIPPH